jgi:hypothetical protein
MGKPEENNSPDKVEVVRTTMVIPTKAPFHQTDGRVL